jgi:SHS2 domain-containing protein
MSVSWEALPKRKSRCRRVFEEDKNSEGGTSPKRRGEEMGASEKIERNVKARSTADRAKGTLQSKDGCDGEFYEYLEHTADVQCHSWGATLNEAFENMIPAMFNYMTDLSLVEVCPEETITFTVSAHDMDSLLFRFMDEFLYRFHSDYFCCKRCKILDFDRQAHKVTVKAQGDVYDLAKHVQGTEIKAITYSNMQIHEKEERSDLYVIVDI